jgi:Ring finger domain
MIKDSLVKFLRSRKYILDYNNGDVVVEGLGSRDIVKMRNGSFECSCAHFNSRMIMCDHIKFTIDKIYQVCHECEPTAILRIVSRDSFENDHNPRFREYFTEPDSQGQQSQQCYICLEDLVGSLKRCRQCDRYYHEACIYGWLRNSPMCGCPNCRKQWH